MDRGAVVQALGELAAQLPLGEHGVLNPSLDVDAVGLPRQDEGIIEPVVEDFQALRVFQILTDGGPGRAVQGADRQRHGLGGRPRDREAGHGGRVALDVHGGQPATQGAQAGANLVRGRVQDVVLGRRRMGMAPQDPEGAAEVPGQRVPQPVLTEAGGRVVRGEAGQVAQRRPVHWVDERAAQLLHRGLGTKRRPERLRTEQHHHGRLEAREVRPEGRQTLRDLRSVPREERELVPRRPFLRDVAAEDGVEVDAVLAEQLAQEVAAFADEWTACEDLLLARGLADDREARLHRLRREVVGHPHTRLPASRRRTTSSKVPTTARTPWSSQSAQQGWGFA